MSFLQTGRLPEPIPKHRLDSLVEFTSGVVGWERQPHGGSVPIHAPLDQPYWLWYCRCGVVGGRRPSAEVAERAHQQHVERMTEAGT